MSGYRKCRVGPEHPWVTIKFHSRSGRLCFCLPFILCFQLPQSKCNWLRFLLINWIEKSLCLGGAWRARMLWCCLSWGVGLNGVLVEVTPASTFDRILSCCCILPRLSDWQPAASRCWLLPLRSVFNSESAGNILELSVCMIHRHLEQMFSVDQAPVLTYSPATKQVVILSQKLISWWESAAFVAPVGGGAVSFGIFRKRFK